MLIWKSNCKMFLSTIVYLYLPSDFQDEKAMYQQYSQCYWGVELKVKDYTFHLIYNLKLCFQSYRTNFSVRYEIGSLTEFLHLRYIYQTRYLKIYIWIRTMILSLFRVFWYVTALWCCQLHANKIQIIQNLRKHHCFGFFICIPFYLKFLPFLTTCWTKGEVFIKLKPSIRVSLHLRNWPDLPILDLDKHH